MLREALAEIRVRFNGRSEAALTPAERSQVAADLRAASTKPVEQVFADLGTGPSGLTPQQVEERREKSGLNQVAHERPPAWYLQLWHGFANAFSFLLAVLATVLWVTDDHESAIIITLMVLISGLLRFFQERRASLAAQKLQEMVRVTCTVVRHDADPKPTEREIPIHDLVPGDVVKLSAGDMVPADVRLLNVKDLFIAQSALTGEALPVEKAPTCAGEPARNPLELPNICLLYTSDAADE